MKFISAPWVKYVGLKLKPVSLFRLYMLLQMFFFMISISVAITELACFHGCVRYMPTHMLTGTVLLEKVICDALSEAKSEILMFVFCHF